MKTQGSTLAVHTILLDWGTEEESGILGVEVKFVDIGRNTSGEGGFLAYY